VAYLYNYAGAPWKTQQRLTQVVATQYNTTPAGLSGNDDLGQMSAWLAFTALGFYPVAPGSNEYVIGSPFLDKAVLNLPNGKRFTIRAPGLSKENVYVAGVTLNGKPLAQTFLRHEQITAGGELVFTMSNRPNTAWGKGVDARPYTQTAYPVEQPAEPPTPHHSGADQRNRPQIVWNERLAAGVGVAETVGDHPPLFSVLVQHQLPPAHLCRGLLRHG
jgi:putative alpha-1,2-mannosidase